MSALTSPRFVRLVVAMLGLACLSSCGHGASWSAGGPADELRALDSALDVTIAEANLHVDRRDGGRTDGVCVSDGPAAHNTTASVVIDLRGENATDVSRRVAAVWERHKNEWFGGGLTLDDRKAGSNDFAYVMLFKGEWALSAQVPANRDLGQYTVGGKSPCR